jgi:hypothetical protein
MALILSLVVVVVVVVVVTDVVVVVTDVVVVDCVVVPRLQVKIKLIYLLKYQYLLCTTKLPALFEMQAGKIIGGS